MRLTATEARVGRTCLGLGAGSGLGSVLGLGLGFGVVLGESVGCTEAGDREQP